MLPFLLLALANETTVAMLPPAPQMATLHAGRDDRRERALARLNAVRRAAGADPLTQSEPLAQSASRHAVYMHANGFESAPTVHAETPGLAGFSGADPFTRMRAAGYRLSYATEVIGDIGLSSGDTDCVDDLMATIYHAALLLSRVTEAGVAYGSGADAGACTIDLAAPLSTARAVGPAGGAIIRYPWPDMVASSGSFRLDSENPRPLPDVLRDPLAGLPVMVGLRAIAPPGPEREGAVQIRSFELRAANGAAIPAVVLADAAITGHGVVPDPALHGFFTALVPRHPLVPGTYRVSLRVASESGGEMAPIAWSFDVAAP